MGFFMGIFMRGPEGSTRVFYKVSMHVLLGPHKGCERVLSGFRGVYGAASLGPR